MHDFDWFVSRLEVAKWNDERPGERDCLTNCPVHGGSDSLHLTEKNGKALVRCFNPACGAKYQDVVDALEGVSDREEEIEEEAAAVTITRRGRRASPAKAQAEAGDVGSTPTASTTPLDWAAARCSMTRKELEALGLPVAETRDAVAFMFGDDAAKLRVAVDGKAKVGWTGEIRPDIWPMPEKVGSTITVCEGEFDALVLRKSGIEAYSVTKGAGTPVDQVVWETLRALGVETVNVCFDVDREGRKGREQAMKDAMSAGLIARPVRPTGLRPLLGDKDARDAVRRNGYPVILEDDVTEDQAVPLTDVDPAEAEDLLLGWLHPNEHTVLFGDGGTGKGVIAAYWVTELASMKKTVLVVDYEQHARHEWRPRVGRFACGFAHPQSDTWHREKPCKQAAEIMDRVFYVQPVAPIWEIAGWLRSEAMRVNADYLVIDSVSYAVSGLEPEKSTTAVKYTQAINAIGFPVLSIGHVTKADADPRHPFGSVYWHNGARITIGVSRRAEEPDSDRIAKHRKANQGQHQGDAAISWDWLYDGLPPRLDFRVAWSSPSEAYRSMLAESGTPPTKEEVEAAFGADISDGAYRKMSSRAGVTVTRRTRSASEDVGSDDDEPDA